MSTTFGVKIKEGIEPIARRISSTGGAKMFFTNSVAELLNDDTEVIPMDNSAQGIETVGDIKKHIERQK